MRRFALALLLPITALSACSNKASVRGVEDAQVRLPAVSGNPGAAYFTLTGGAADDTMTEVSSPQAIRAEMHESKMDGGVMKMRPIAGGVPVPAGETVRFAPGGKHVMLFDINPAVKAGGKMTLVFSYADGSKVEAVAAVKAAGDAMNGHDH